MPKWSLAFVGSNPTSSWWVGVCHHNPKPKQPELGTPVVTYFLGIFEEHLSEKTINCHKGLELTLLETKIAPGNHFTIVQDYPLRSTWRFIWYISISNSRFIYKSWELGGSSWFFELPLGLGQSRQLAPPTRHGHKDRERMSLADWQDSPERWGWRWSCTASMVMLVATVDGRNPKQPPGMYETL